MDPFGEGLSPVARGGAPIALPPASARSSRCASCSTSTARRRLVCSVSAHRRLHTASPGALEARREDESMTSSPELIHELRAVAACGACSSSCPRSRDRGRGDGRARPGAGHGSHAARALVAIPAAAAVALASAGVLGLARSDVSTDASRQLTLEEKAATRRPHPRRSSALRRTPLSAPTTAARSASARRSRSRWPTRTRSLAPLRRLSTSPALSAATSSAPPSRRARRAAPR